MSTEPDYTDRMPAAEIAKEVGKDGEPGSRRHSQLQAILLAKCTGDIERSLNLLRESQENASKSATILADRIHKLNMVLTAATILGSIGAIAQAIYLFAK